MFNSYHVDISRLSSSGTVLSRSITTVWQGYSAKQKIPGLDRICWIQDSWNKEQTSLTHIWWKVILLISGFLQSLNAKFKTISSLFPKVFLFPDSTGYQISNWWKPPKKKTATKLFPWYTANIQESIYNRDTKEF